MATVPIPGVNTPTYQTWAKTVADRVNAIDCIRVDTTTDASGNVHILNSVWQGTVPGANGFHVTAGCTGLQIRTEVNIAADRIIVSVLKWVAPNNYTGAANQPVFIFITAFNTATI